MSKKQTLGLLKPPWFPLLGSLPASHSTGPGNPCTKETCSSKERPMARYQHLGWAYNLIILVSHRAKARKCSISKWREVEDSKTLQALPPWVVVNQHGPWWTAIGSWSLSKEWVALQMILLGIWTDFWRSFCKYPSHIFEGPSWFMLLFCTFLGSLVDPSQDESKTEASLGSLNAVWTFHTRVSWSKHVLKVPLLECWESEKKPNTFSSHREFTEFLFLKQINYMNICWLPTT